jgi:uncharacterized protein (DUF2141 family)
MTAFLPAFRSPDRPARAAALAAVGLALGAAPLAAQAYTYARTGPNDMGLCAPGKGPAVRITVTGLKSSEGNLFVRAYPANSRDWLQSKRYIMRIDAKPQAGTTTVCVPLPTAGDYAIAVQHDANSNGKTDLSDGAGMSNNPGVKKVLGLIPRPPSVEKTRFTASDGITRMTISMQYM